MVPGVPMVMVTERLILPLAPLQLRVNVVVALSAAVGTEPEVGFDPLQAPDAVQLETLLDVQFSTEVLPLGIIVRFAPSASDAAVDGGVEEPGLVAGPDPLVPEYPPPTDPPPQAATARVNISSELQAKNARADAKMLPIVLCM
jgi:hypothetical protein